jgi:putative ABC transport system permease protein
MPFYLAVKEILRNKFRFTAVILIVALITLLVLFIAGLADGLALAGKQYIENIDAELILFQEDVDISIPTSQLDRAKLNDIERVAGVAAAGPIGFSTAAIVLDGQAEPLAKIDVALIGIEPDKPGAPAVFNGSQLQGRDTNEVIIDQNILEKVNLPIGTVINLKVVQGAREEIYPLKVVGHTTGQQYFFLPGVFTPLQTWERIRPKFNPDESSTKITFNIAAVKLEEPDTWPEMMQVIERQVNGIEAADPITTYENTVGYREQQDTFDLQQVFTLFIALLVIGGFFQIQTLQKVNQIGMLKAIGLSDRLIALTLLVQISLITLIGVVIGGGAVWLLASNLPPGIPVEFDGPKITFAIISLLVIGPLAGLVSVRTLLKVEPLTALGLGT